MTRLAEVRTMVGLAIAALVVGSVAIGVSSAQVPAQNGGQATPRGRRTAAAGPLGVMRRGLAQLNLSDEQKQQITSIVRGRKAELKSFSDGMRRARRAVADAIANEEGEAAIRARSAELAKVQADLAVFRADLRKQVIGVLTPEQQAKLKEFRVKVRERTALTRRRACPSPSSPPTR